MSPRKQSRIKNKLLIRWGEGLSHKISPYDAGRHRRPYSFTSSLLTLAPLFQNFDLVTLRRYNHTIIGGYHETRIDTEHNNILIIINMSMYIFLFISLILYIKMVSKIYLSSNFITQGPNLPWLS